MREKEEENEILSLRKKEMTKLIIRERGEKGKVKGGR